MSDIRTNEEEGKKSLNFIEANVEKDLAEGKNGGRIQTRFPPEPNGYLHIGPVSYTHLDVYKRQVQAVKKRETQVKGNVFPPVVLKLASECSRSLFSFQVLIIIGRNTG